MQRHSLAALRRFFREPPRQGSVTLETVGLLPTSGTPGQPVAFATPTGGAPLPPSGRLPPTATADDPVAIVRLSNPARRNAVSPSMMRDLDDVVGVLEADFRGVCVVLTGDGGKAFCAGADLTAVMTDAEASSDSGGRGGGSGGNKSGSGGGGGQAGALAGTDAGDMMSAYMQGVLRRWQRLPQITVAALNGHAVGGGAEVATACDHRVAAAAATLRFVHPLMGVSPGWGGGTRLTKIVGRSRALQLLAGARRVGAPAALEWGLVDAVVAPQPASLGSSNSSGNDNAGDGNADDSYHRDGAGVSGGDGDDHDPSGAVAAALDFAATYVHPACLHHGRGAVRGIKRVVHAADCDDDTGVPLEGQQLLPPPPSLPTASGRQGRHGGARTPADDGRGRGEAECEQTVAGEREGDGGSGDGGAVARSMAHERRVFASLWGHEENQFAIDRKLRLRRESSSNGNIN